LPFITAVGKLIPGFNIITSCMTFSLSLPVRVSTST
jgi:hypothetical protein